jgi:tungstate transport system substrate-binding protein
MTSRSLLALLLVAGLAAVVGGGFPAAAQPRVVMLASTIGPVDAGIVSALEEAYHKRAGVIVRHAGAGTGAALEMSKSGSFDLVMVHARALEDKFVADGFGIDRRDVMYNDFVILGPAADPARIHGEKTAVDALRKIAAAQAPFLTRGDRSGTHVKETELWAAAGVAPRGAWYVTSERGSAGNAPTTRDANGRQSYVLMDRATYLTLKREISLQVLVEKDPALLNYIAVIRVNPAKLPKVNSEGARAFQDWLVSEEAQRIIKDFEVARYGEPLFFPNSDEWRKRHGGGS